MSTPDALIADRYRLVRKLGSGGMGVVWEAWDERLHRRVALKQLRPQPGLAPDELQLANDRALREARINARLHHRYAVPVFDVVEHDGQPCLIMQYVSSVPLSAVLRDGGPLQPAEAAKVGAQVASALAEAHQAGIVHRDIKPGNILIADDGTAMISDFGISHAMGDVTLTQTGMVHGTPAYLAPEVARGASASFASDVFSLGATLYATLEGSPPFGTDPNSIALLYRVAAGSFDEPQNGGPLTPVVVEMLAADPEARPDMATVARRLAALETQGAAINDPAAAPTVALAAADEAASAPDKGTAPPPPPAPTVPMPESMRTTHVAPREVSEHSEMVTPVRAAAPSVRPNAPRPPADSETPAETRRRPSRILLAVAAVVVLAAVVTAIILGTRGGGPVTAAPTPGTSAPEATASATDATPSTSETPSTESSPSPSATASSTSASPTPTSTPSPSPSKSASGKPSAAELAAAISSYYALMPDNTDAAWPKLTSSYQRNTTGGKKAYENYWGQISKVSATDVSGNPPDGAQATITYTYKGGKVVKEKTSFRLVEDGGVLKINSTRILRGN
jgi:serine/threonine protein kinase